MVPISASVSKGLYVLRRKPRFRRGVIGSLQPALAGWLIAGVGSDCSVVGGGSPSQPTAPTSVQTLEYYPYQVKGYQNSYPHRTILVLLPTDARDLNGPNAAPLDGQPAHRHCHRSDPKTSFSDFIQHRSPPIVQGAIARSAEEAGFPFEREKIKATMPATQCSNAGLCARDPDHQVLGEEASRTRRTLWCRPGARWRTLRFR